MIKQADTVKKTIEIVVKSIVLMGIFESNNIYETSK